MSKIKVVIFLHQAIPVPKSFAPYAPILFQLEIFEQITNQINMKEKGCVKIVIFLQLAIPVPKSFVPTSQILFPLETQEKIKNQINMEEKGWQKLWISLVFQLCCDDVKVVIFLHQVIPVLKYFVPSSPILFPLEIYVISKVKVVIFLQQAIPVPKSFAPSAPILLSLEIQEQIINQINMDEKGCIKVVIFLHQVIPILKSFAPSAPILFQLEIYEQIKKQINIKERIVKNYSFHRIKVVMFLHQAIPVPKSFAPTSPILFPLEIYEQITNQINMEVKGWQKTMAFVSILVIL
ncbi:hypothetical protein TTHERM_01439780 (macronuclear) [Tetrahymena thermophila SB210]|uniref:Uncharacterized protein n=1 Tax=Tetrahymena thermophila (strain SB210) TaxID=312017 RepID=Q24BL6_TETTS|nr:hypothetical protein TTHERM_01439780 [Tetrahymena thermophila SB210]EAS05173.3 hypothetical protein TTHERM_01439780 [Tetrahymena thermophila SB210]|eukprot:XP_001025418.3 hypothetical protein TTHERM_01439780 [Tetrahymena thermophila SB210]